MYIKFKKYLVLGTVIFLVAIFLPASIYVISEGERGVLTRNGRFVNVREPGLGIKIPIIDRVTKLEIRNMSIKSNVYVYSSDTQQYTAMITINYNLNPAHVEEVFKREGVHYASRRLAPILETQMKEVAGKYSAQRTIQERDKFGGDVKVAVQDAAKVYKIDVSEVQITNIDFTDQFEQAIENAMLAKAKVEEERNILEQKKIKAETMVVEATAEANAARERAKGEADAKTINAKAEAERILKIGESEALAIKKKADALKNNPELTAYTYSLAALQWDGKLPQQFVPNTTLPILDVNSKK